MKILIRNLSNTFNYGSMMMGENLISYLVKKMSNHRLSFYIDTDEDIHIKRLIEATQYPKIYKDEFSNINLITKNIKYIRLLEQIIRKKENLKKIVDYYDCIIILGGDDYAETYYKIPRDNLLIKSILDEIKYLSSKLKVYMIGQTIGPYTGQRIKWAEAAFKNVNLYSRDDYSADYVERTFAKQVEKSRDLAFLDLNLQSIYDKNAEEILETYGIKSNQYITFVGTSLILHYTSCEDDMIDKVFTMLKKIKDNFPQYKVVWLSHVVTPNSENDNNLLIKINKKYNNYITNNCIVINNQLFPIEARIILGNGLMTVTCRMHAAVSTFQMGKPAICLSYSNKYNGVIAQGLKLQDLVIDAKGDSVWSGNIDEIIIDKVNYVINNNEELIKKIKKEVIKSQQKVIDSLDKIIRELSGDTSE